MNVRQTRWPLIAGTTIGLSVLIAAILGLQQQQLHALQNPASETLAADATNEEQQRELQLALLESLPDFGFRNLWADWVFLIFLQYFGNFEYRQETSYRLSGDYFEIILDRDPYAYLPYEYLSSSVSLFAGEPERAVALQEKRIESIWLQTFRLRVISSGGTRALMKSYFWTTMMHRPNLMTWLPVGRHNPLCPLRKRTNIR
jgi:hypothetical protein